jgi:hypothetical protein
VKLGEKIPEQFLFPVQVDPPLDQLHLMNPAEETLFGLIDVIIAVDLLLIVEVLPMRELSMFHAVSRHLNESVVQQSPILAAH